MVHLPGCFPDTRILIYPCSISCMRNSYVSKCQIDLVERSTILPLLFRLQLCNGLFLSMLFAQNMFCCGHNTTTQSDSSSFCAKFKFDNQQTNPIYALPLDFMALPQPNGSQILQTLFRGFSSF